MKIDNIEHKEEVVIVGWIEGISGAINYIEDHITEELAIENIPCRAIGFRHDKNSEEI